MPFKFALENLTNRADNYFFSVYTLFFFTQIPKLIIFQIQITPKSNLRFHSPFTRRPQNIMHDLYSSLALGKVLLAAAWSNENITSHEEVWLRDFLLKLPRINKLAFEEFESHFVEAIDERDRVLLLLDLRRHLKNEAERCYAIQAIQQFFLVRGNASQENWEILNQFIRMIQGEPTEILTEITQIVKNPEDVEALPKAG